MDKVNILDELSKPGFNVALFTSYSIDISFFEKMILHKLLDQGCSYIGLFIDQNCLEYALKEEKYAADLGRAYAVNGIFCGNAFHPKVFLLLGEEKAKLIVGSGNITPSGFITNGEMFSVFTYDENNSTFLPLIQKAYRMVKVFNHIQNSSSMKNIFSRADDFHYIKNIKMDMEPADVLFIDNCAHSLYEQILPALPEKVESIDIMVPYFDRSLEVVEKFLKDINPEKISIYLQNRTSNFPIKKTISQNCKCYEFHNKELDRRYHGKVFRFVGLEKEVIVYGSANCGNQAVLKVLGKGGNSEAVILETGNRGEFNSLFTDDIEYWPISEDFEVIDEDMEFESKSFNIHFIEAVLTDGKLTIYLKSIEIIDEVSINDIPGNLKATANGVVSVSWDSSRINIPSIFSFNVSIKGQWISAIGWYHNADALIRTQLKENQLPYFSLKDDPEIKNYQNMVGLLDDFLKRLVLTEEDLDNKPFVKSAASVIHELSDKDEKIAINSNIEDYYANESEVHIIYGSEKGYDVLGELIKQLMRPFYEKTNSIKRNDDNVVNLNIEGGQCRSNNQFTQIIDKMRKFINKFNKGITSEAYIEKVNDEILVKNFIIYSEFLWKVYEKQENEELLTKDWILAHYIDITDIICKFGKKNIIEHSLLDDYIIPLSLSAVFVMDQKLDMGESLNVVRYERKKLEKILKNMHSSLKPIRTNYINYYNVASKHIERFGIIPTLDEFKKRMEVRFPFSTLEIFYQYLSNRFGDSLRKIPTQYECRIEVLFNLKDQVALHIRQLDILKRMLTVDEYEDQSVFETLWVNTNKEAPMKEYKIIYNKTDKTLIKLYMYRIGKSERKEIKRYVDNLQIINAAETNNFEFLVDGFK